jgi:hypothetical protein
MFALSRQLLPEGASGHQASELLSEYIRRYRQSTYCEIDTCNDAKNRLWTHLRHPSVRIRCRRKSKDCLCEVDRDKSLVCVPGMAIDDVRQRRSRCEWNREGVDGHEHNRPNNGHALLCGHTKADEANRGEDCCWNHEDETKFGFKHALVTTSHELSPIVVNR